MKRSWTEGDVANLLNNIDRYTIKHLAWLLGRSYNSVLNKLYKELTK